MRHLILTFFLSVAAGCMSEGTYTASRPQTEPTFEPWVPSLSPKQAQALSPEEAKAILVARAAVEAQAKAAASPQPVILSFRADRADEGWRVFVQFVGFWDEGRADAAPGYFCTVVIDKNWTVQKIVGGA